MGSYFLFDEIQSVMPVLRRWDSDESGDVLQRYDTSAEEKLHCNPALSHPFIESVNVP